MKSKGTTDIGDVLHGKPVVQKDSVITDVPEQLRRAFLVRNMFLLSF